MFIGSEIAYALTNEKGRTRTDQANEKYYEGIRSTKYAPMVKYADRIANLRYSVMNAIEHESESEEDEYSWHSRFCGKYNWIILHI